MTQQITSRQDIRDYLDQPFFEGYKVGFSQGAFERENQVCIDELHPSAGGASADYCAGYDYGQQDGSDGIEGHMGIRLAEYQNR